MPNGFRHNEQSVRVVTKLENEGKGLNLTKEVIDGILHHSGLRSASDDKGALTLEGRVVQVSDKIAYINHDIDDSIRAGLLSENDIPKELLKALGKTHSERIETLVLDFINTSNKNLEEGINSVGLSKEIEEAMRELRAFMFKNIYLSNELKGERNKAKFILNELINHYMEHIEEMPELYRNIAECEGAKRGVADYIAGMSDDYCLSQLNELINHYMEHIEEMPELYRNIAECEGAKRGVADYIAGMSDDYCLSQFNKIFVPKLVIY